MKLNLISITVLAALAASTSAQAADTFSFDPTGGGSTAINTAITIDQAPGNAIGVGGNQAFVNYVNQSGSTAFTTYYQANLNSILDPTSTSVFTNGGGGNFFTFTAGFGESINAAFTGGGVGFANFIFDSSNPVNFFNMYATGAVANNLTGAGFVNGSPILNGHVVSITTSSFTSNTGSSVALDQFNGDSWAGQQTVTGAGSTNITIMIDAANAGYFPDLPIGQKIVLSMFNNSQVDPYNQVDPSKCFNTSTSCTSGGYIPNIGALNGGVSGTPGSLIASGPDFIFQADANESFTVPEPGSVALLGLGLALLGLRSVRRRTA